MRILQVSSASKLGGGETHVIELVAGLRAVEHQVLLAGRARGPLEPDIVLPLLNSADFVSALKLRRVLRQQRIDIVHAHVARDYPVVAAAAWRVTNVKVVLTRHLLYPIKPHALYRRVDGWLAPTAQILKTLDPLRPKRGAVLPNWVDAGKFRFDPHELNNPVRVGILGQISPHKGHDDAVEAMRSLGPGFRLLVAGDGEDQYIESLKKRSIGLNVEFCGVVAAPDFLKSIDVLAVPSWEEPFGIVLLEAMAAGIPVVATARGGPLEIVRSEEHGLLIPPRDPAALAEAIRRLTEYAELRRSIVHQARERVETEFDQRRIIPRIDEFYRSL